VPPEALAGSITNFTPEAIARFDQLRARLDAHQQWINSDGKLGRPGCLDNEDLRPVQKLVVGRLLGGLLARNVIAIGLNFSGCQLPGARFDGSDLRDADFTGADLRGASFWGCKIEHARFEKADLRSLQLANGSQRCVDFSESLGTDD
jgi:uncharacterized protein YjbI with pentapeptide repeats